MAILIIAIVFCLWYGSQTVLNTPYPALAVASGSMCKAQHMHCDGWSHPFESTLHIGDLIIVQGINPEEIKAESYPYGDIIIFHKPKDRVNSLDELIVHRAIESRINLNNGLMYFETKGDGNTSEDPFDHDYRGENYTWDGKISENLVVGKVVMRIPWIGHIALFMHGSSGMFIIVILIVILVVAEVIIPVFSSEKVDVIQNEDEEDAFEPTSLCGAFIKIIKTLAYKKWCSCRKQYIYTSKMLWHLQR